MLSITSISVLWWSLMSTTLAVPKSVQIGSTVSSERSLRKRDPCNQVDATYVLYKDYDQNACKAPHPSNYGDCFPLYSIAPPNFLKPKECSIFCQQHVQFVYGREVIMPLSICHHPMTCTINKAIAKSIQKGFTFSGNLSPSLGENFVKVTLQAGLSYDYKWTRMETNTQSFAVTPKEGQCGYFAFIPHMIVSCGLWANAPPGHNCPQPKQHVNPTVEGCTSDYVTVKDENNENRHQGATIFVYTDCKTNEPLPCGDGTIQDEAYCQDGVALPRAQAVSALSALPSASTSLAGTNKTVIVTETFSDPSSTVALNTVVETLEPSVVTSSGPLPAVTVTNRSASSVPVATVWTGSAAATASP